MSSSPAPTATTGSGRSSLNALRSLALLQDLQQYVQGVESEAASCRHQLHELQDKKRELERLNKPLREKKRYDDPSEFMNARDLPPKMRSLFEDLRIFKERVKKYKDQVAACERTISQRDAQILKLQDKNQQLSDTLKQSKVSSKDMKDYEAMRADLEKQLNANRDLSSRMNILQRSKEVDARKFKRTIAEETKATEAAKEEAKRCKELAETREREIKRLTVELRRSKKEHDMTRSSIIQLQRSARSSAAAPEADANGEASALAAAPERDAPPAAAAPEDAKLDDNNSKESTDEAAADAAPSAPGTLEATDTTAPSVETGNDADDEPKEKNGQSPSGAETMSSPEEEETGAAKEEEVSADTEEAAPATKSEEADAAAAKNVEEKDPSIQTADGDAADANGNAEITASAPANGGDDESGS